MANQSEQICDFKSMKFFILGFYLELLREEKKLDYKEYTVEEDDKTKSVAIRRIILHE